MKSIILHIANLDILLTNKVSNFTGKRLLDYLMYMFSRLGDGWIYPIIGLALIIDNFELGITFCIVTALAFAIELPIQLLLKFGFKRKRPFVANENIDYLIAPPDEYSFPSGHTAGAFLFVNSMVSLYGDVNYLLFPLAILIGFSRIYNCVHYLSDVLIGALLGTISLFIALEIVF